MSETPDPDDRALFAPGTFGCPEALHMASVLAEMVDRHLAEHPAVTANPDWKALADRACDALNDLYQAIGSAHLDDGSAARPAARPAGA
jgi:hypothetical protein